MLFFWTIYSSKNHGEEKQIKQNKTQKTQNKTILFTSNNKNCQISNIRIISERSCDTKDLE